MLGFNDDDRAAGLEDAHECIGDLRGQALLHLWALGIDIDEPCQFRQPRDAAILIGYVADVSAP